MIKRLKKLHTNAIDQQGTKWGIWALFIGTFADACLLPLPVQTFFLFLILMNSEKSLKYIIAGSIGTLTGALAGYMIGYFIFLNDHGAYSGFAQFVFHHLPGFSEDAYNKIQVLYSKSGFWLLLTAAFTPIPYGIFSISSGAFEINLFIFCLATVISQALKFIITAFLAKKVGPGISKIFVYKIKPYAVLAVVCVAIMVLVP